MWVHVYSRGIARGLIFTDDEDRRRFLQLLRRLLRDCRMRCFAWALMPNHYHLFVATSDVPISTFMARLNTGFAIWFNARHGRVGHVFQGRFGSRVVERESYSLELVRYIHLNPVRAGLIAADDLATYPWTGHADLTGARRLPIVATGEVLAQFGGDGPMALQALESFTMDGLGEELDPRLEVSSTDTRHDRASCMSAGIVGDDAYVELMLRTQQDRALRQARMRARGWTIQRLLRIASRRSGTHAAVVAAGRRTRRVANARALTCFLARQHLGSSFAEIARAVGTSRAAASRCFDRGRELGRPRCANRRRKS
jgi:REP element-mobilizing transposase RayT